MADTQTQTRPLPDDFQSQPNIWDAALTYYADGTRVARRGHPQTAGTTAGITVDAVAYQFQVVDWDDGGRTNTAPHVLVKITEPAEASNA
jgi:hypothetical protein